MAQDGGLTKLQRRLKALPEEVKKAVQPALEKSAEEITGAMKQFAESSRDTGGLIDSIAITLPSERTPAYSQPGGAKVVEENQVAITVGNSGVRYPHFVEYGTSKAAAQPFFWPAFRLHRKRAERRIKAAIRKAVKDLRR